MSVWCIEEPVSVNMLDWVVIVLALIILYRWLNAKPDNFPPGPPTVPFAGSIPFIQSNNFHLFLEKIKEKYGPVMGFKFGNFNAVSVAGPEEIIQVLKSDDFSGRPSFATGRSCTGIMFANGAHWKDQRRFAIRHLRDFGFGKTTVAETVRQEFEQFCSNKLKGKKTIEGTRLFNTSAINVLWAMMSGSLINYDDEEFRTLLKHLEKLFRTGNVAVGIFNAFPKIKKFISLFYEFHDDKTGRHLDQFFLKSLDKHRATQTSEPRDLFDVYLTELEKPGLPPSFSLNTLLEVSRDLFAAGVESSANTTSFAVMYLLLHPEWQEKVRKEIDDVLKGQPPCWEDRSRLPLTEAFLNEVQRCNTIAPLTVPHCATKDTTLNGYSIPQGTIVNVSLWGLLQDRKHWGDPENFRPERFIGPEGECIKDPYMLIFGSGPRVCPGENLARTFVFLFFILLLQHYKFNLPEGASKPSTVCLGGFTTAPQTFFMDLEVRK